ncbi:SDR family NAD(P)-dependent oxidoreductase [Acinetobacter rudis]|uniref:SDR family NAD(P)-dependent oxidoreductase n=1 Tax=Acinetobacter rudis TaxID=632955 RepID=A0AAW8J7S1_9GAMM|nr:SDR family NAD(P)-dependent oxidoreductase [Acinetobacter rudis]MDQ8935162.1 SDR family NAD(P)-dependent oxidoreductase [Acinetobacter rudis]MDQ8953025.1 SDR family NAD(P)-dependent oxidoreductase [Acinetobacter rudis]MDQ9017030.1 SDR family NAD(P)-dependent oxidoreductase [Acinetobacter rudis]
MSKKIKILIIGATSTIAEHCARQWLKQQPCEIILCSRNLEKLQRVSQDLKVRYPEAELHLKTLNFLDAVEIEQYINTLYQHHTIDIALIAHGVLPDQEKCQTNLESCQYTMQVNAISPLLFTETIIKHMIEKDHGKLAIISSVAADRARKSNYIYGSAKAMIDKYIQGLQHRLALLHSSVDVTLVKPGPTATTMTLGMTSKGKLASAEDVAQDIVQAIQISKPTLYTPSKWRLLMFIIRHIPFFLFKKIDI